MYQLNDRVLLNYTHDEYDRPIEKKTPFFISRINTSDRVPYRGWDYEITSFETSNTFYVLEGEIHAAPSQTTPTEITQQAIDVE